MSSRSVKEAVYRYVCKHPEATEEEISAVLNVLVVLEKEGRVKS